MKTYVVIGEACNTIVRWINSGEYRQFVEASQGETKDDGFRAACFILPSILLTKCDVTYIEE